MPSEGSDPREEPTSSRGGRGPRLPPLLVSRPRLLALLDAATPLTLLRAPVGFGKTTLVAQWLSVRGRSAPGVVTWMRVRPGAGDVATFWAELLQVVSDAGLRPPSEVAPHSGAFDPAGRAERAIRAAEGPIVLVVDGFEHVTDPDLDRSLLDLLRHAPQLQLVVCLRGHRHFPAHLYLDLDTTVLTARELRFTEDETQQLLHTAGVALPESGVRHIVEESGGWPEPTRAIVLRLRGSLPESAKLSEAGLAEVVEGIAAEYLKQRLLSEAHPPGRIEVAILTSLPEDFSADVAELLADHQTTKAHLEVLSTDSVLSVEVRDGQAVYRWPPAARRALLGELRRRWPDRLPELHRRLGHWYRDHDQPHLALRHALESQDWLLAISVIESSWRNLIFVHQDDLLRAYVEMPLEIVETSPRALALRDTELRMPDDRLLGIAVLPDSPSEQDFLDGRVNAADLLDTCFVIVMALRRRGAIGLAATYGRRALEIARTARATQPRAVIGLYPSLHLHVGMTQLLAGDAIAAMDTLRHAYDRGADHPLGYGEADAAGKLALAHAMVGDLRQATTWTERHEAAPRWADTWLQPHIRSAPTAARLLVALDRLEIDPAVAANDLLAAHPRRDELWPFLVYARAQLSLVLGAASEGLVLIDRARSTYRDWMGPGAVGRPLLAAAEADMLLSLGRGNLARAVLSGADADHPLLRVARARLALLSDQPDVAMQLSQGSRWERIATARDRLEMLVLRSVAAGRTGDPGVAEAALSRAVDLGRANGSLRAFANVPRAELAAIAERVPAARDLLHKDPLETQPDLFPSAIQLIELTKREQQVLEQLATPLTIPQIAQASVLSYNTVRFQQRNLYKKLGTSDRAEAIARARQWGLLR
ncbi:LuxR C-terminal-related transcriptional regulator [Nocardioides sp. LHG3406-4]|uniref:LuxR C-terminal-related transcriptional regulator n=1 Tax=Nocardioides sp. LHG3406-4 TaxID=2804575 RepID=UPI003CEAB293